MVDFLETLLFVLCVIECAPLLLWIAPERNPLKPKALTFISEWKLLHSFADYGYTPLKFLLLLEILYEIGRKVSSDIYDSPLDYNVRNRNYWRHMLSLVDCLSFCSGCYFIARPSHPFNFCAGHLGCYFSVVLARSVLEHDPCNRVEPVSQMVDYSLRSETSFGARYRA